MQQIAEQKSGMLKIVLCNAERDETAEKMISILQEKEGLLHYVEVASEEDAVAAVLSNEADAAWIFEKDVAKKLQKYTEKGGKREPVIKVVEREDDVALQLSREKLYGTLYPEIAYAVYENYIKELPELEHLNEEMKREAYEKTKMEGSLFRFAYADERVDTAKADEHYLLLPMRGLLCLLMMLCGLAAAMYLLQDEKAGKFVWIAPGYKQWFFLFYYIPVLLPFGLAVLAALAWSGLMVSVGKELICMLLYMLMTIGFCELIRKWAGTVERLGAAIPLLLLGMLVICPIFMELRNLRILQYLLPPFYYLTALYNSAFLGKTMVYLIGIYALIFITKRGKA